MQDPPCVGLCKLLTIGDCDVGDLTKKPTLHPRGIGAEQMSNGHPICHYLFHIKGSVEVSNGWEHLGEYHSVSVQFQCHKVSIVLPLMQGSLCDSNWCDTKHGVVTDCNFWMLGNKPCTFTATSPQDTKLIWYDPLCSLSSVCCVYPEWRI